MDYQSFVPIDGDEYCAYQVSVYERVRIGEEGEWVESE